MRAHRHVVGRRGAAYHPGCACAGFTKALLRRTVSVVPSGFALDAGTSEGIATDRRRLIRDFDDENEHPEYWQRADTDCSGRGLAEHRLLSETQDEGAAQPALRPHE